MRVETDRPTLTDQRSTFIILFALASGVILIGGAVLHSPSEFALRFNPYALLSLSAMVLSLTILLLVLWRGTKSESRTWFIFYLVSSVVIASTEALQRLSATPAGALFWDQLISLGFVLVPVAIYMFALSYTHTTALRNGLLVPVMLVIAALFVFFCSNNALVFQEAMKRYPWGYNNQPGELFVFNVLWIVVPYGAAIVMFAKYRAKSKNPLLRQQMLFYMIALSTPLVGGVITDGILPLTPYHTPSMAVFINNIAGAIIYYGIRHYEFFQIDPTTISDNILNTMREAVLVAGRDLHIEYANREAEVLFGLQTKRSDMVRLDALFPKESWEKVFGNLTKGEPLPKEVGHIVANGPAGAPVPVQVSTSLLNDRNNYVAYIVVVSDISTIATSYNNLQTSAIRIRKLLDESQSLERQLAHEKANVEHTVEERTKELRQAQERLKAEDRMKREFIALSSHNLRTPLTVIQGSLQLIKNADQPDERESLLANMETGVKRLSGFIADLSAITTLESGSQLEAKPISLNELLRPVIEESRSFITAKHLAFNVDLDLADTMINANILWLQNCIRNLLDNAVKFTESGSISVITQKSSEELVAIVVSDTGVGIQPEEIPLLFTKFHRATSYEQYNYEGEGLGLYLTKLIVEQHGGHIEVKSTLGSGSTFTIFLPVAHT